MKFELSYLPPICLNRAMRGPDRVELEFAMIAFAVLAPLAYFTARGLVALVG